ncbi:hypothetical protein LJY25_13050 [Hymenobacter sp. BT175]|uniref:hypothetical protein n=1 Tax=Hymenobacter translucens TaxID=2886507 RepID=UPI001D0E98EF|nr:hypothetical protein [Hymenobacter translucens]MCC2547376.1 hypothetical protein [Hymenobacter translucens]
MGKHKKKHSKKEELEDDLLDAAVVTIRKFRQISKEISKLSAGQKLFGGLGLLAAGYLYLTKFQDADGGKSAFQMPNLSLPKLLEAKNEKEPEEAEAEEAAPAAPARKSRKSPKSGKSHGSAGKRPAASPDDI